MSTSLIVPDIGDFKDVEIIEILVKPGDTIALDQSVLTVESDKASMEIPATAAGTLVSLSVKLGDRVSQGTVLGAVEGSSAPGVIVANAVVADAVAVLAAAAPATAAAAPAAAAPASALAPASSESLPHASPSVRRFARELGVDLLRVQGTGIKGRITQEDVQAFVKGVMAQPLGAPATPGALGAQGSGSSLDLLPWPSVDFEKFGPVQREPLSRIKKISGANLHRNWVMIPHVTGNDDADITELEAFRVQMNREHEKDGVKLTMLAFLIKASVVALKKYPVFNASLDGDSLVLKNYFHIGFAADTPNGLVVPVLRDADRKGVLEIAAETSALAKKARDGKLSPSEMQGGCFSISSLGGIGGTHFTPIINAPEVAILGVSKSAMRPVWNGSAFEPRLILPLSLSYDHRVIDGAAAARFNALLVQLLADFRRISL